MKLFKKIKPRDAEVWKTNRWVCYDSTSLRVGDIIRLSDNDIIPADCKILSLGTEYVQSDKSENTSAPSKDIALEFIVDSSNVTGRLKPDTICINQGGSVEPSEIYACSVVLQGVAIAVVTAIGKQTLISKLISQKNWPPTNQYETIRTNDDDDTKAIELT